MFFALLDAGIARISADVVLITMQQLSTWVTSATLAAVTNSRAPAPTHRQHLRAFYNELILIAPLRLMHFQVAFAVFVLGHTGRMNQRGINEGALSQ